MDCRKNKAPRPLHHPPKIPIRTTPGERERVATLSHPVPRGGVGERSAPRPRRRKPNSHPNSPSRRQEPASPPKPLPASSEMKPHPNSPLRHRKPASPPKPFPESSETQIPAEPAPGERERVSTLSHPVTRGGVGERSAPRPLRRKPNSSPECLHCQKSKSPPAQPHGRAREGRSPLAPRPPRGCRGAERPTPVSSETEFSTRTVKPAPLEIQIPARTARGERERV